MKFISILPLLFLSLFTINTAAANVKSDLRCFTDVTGVNTKLEIMFYSDELNSWAGGYVRYGKNKPTIPIVFQSIKKIDEEAGRPSSFKTVWLEVATGEVTGKYTIETQGANAYSLEYLARKTNKKYSFNESTQRSLANDGCKW